MKLTAGAVVDLFTSPCAAGITVPVVVQVTKVTPTGPGNGAGSRLVVSDGAHFMSCTLSKLVDDMIKTGMVGKHSVVRFVQYTLEDHVDKSDASKQIRSVVVAAMEHLGAQERVGTPVDVTKDASVKRHRGRVQKQGGGQAQAQAQAQAPKARGTAEAYSTIASLNPYRNKWIFKARVTKRGDKKTWSNAKGEGSLFSVDLLDAEGTEIRATFWKEAVDMFYDMLPPGSVATFSGGKLKSANLKFTTIKNPYELTFDASSTIKLAADTDGTIKSASFAFVKLAEVERAENDATVDVVGVVTDFTGVSSLTAKASGRELFKRDVTLVDDSGVAVRLTLWGADAQRDDAAFCGNTVMCVKGARVGEYHGKNLSSGFSSVVMLDATDVPEAVALKAWWAASGSSTPAKTLSCGQRGRFEDRKGVSVIRDDALGYGQGPDWVDIKAHITFVNTGGTFCYAACPEPDNHKKVMLQTDGTWLCEATNRTYTKPEYRYILSFRVADPTGSVFVTAFNDEAMQLMGCTAGALKHAQDTDPVAFEAACARLLFKELVLTLRCKAESYKDEMRVRVSVQRFNQADIVKESQAMIAALNAT